VFKVLVVCSSSALDLWDARQTCASTFKVPSVRQIVKSSSLIAYCDAVPEQAIDFCRLNHALANCMRKQMHAEMLVKQVVEHSVFKVELLDFFFFRVRANGLLADKDFKPQWKRHAIPRCASAMFKPFEERASELAAAEAKKKPVDMHRKVPDADKVASENAGGKNLLL
jgi:hypothetical protein